MSEPAGRTAGAGPPILVEDDGNVRHITFNRPEARNALNSRCYRLLAEALDSASGAPSVKCVLVTGAGDHFCAGLDLRDDELEADAAWQVYDEFISRLEQFSKPLMAAVAGVAVGIGATMLGHFDLIFAGRSARFRLPFLSLGLSPEAGSTFTMPSAMGAQATAHALFTGSWISAEEAAAAGLVWRLADDALLLDEAAEECAQVAKMPVASLVATKKLLLANKLGPTRSARQREEAEFRRLQAGPDHAEALAAFAERRQPVF